MWNVSASSAGARFRDARSSSPRLSASTAPLLPASSSSALNRGAHTTVVGVVGATHGGAQRRPQAGVGEAVLDAAGHGAHDERPEVRPIARLIDADDPDHSRAPSGWLSLPS